MTGTPVLIDLGDLPRVDPEPADPSRRRPRRSARRNWPAVVAVLALVVGTVHAADRPSELVPVASLSMAGDNFAIHGDTLYLTPRGQGGGGGPLIAYRLSDGVPRWTLPAEEGPFFAVLTVAGQPLAVSGRCPRLSGTDVTAFDPATGAVRWRHFGQLLGAAGSGQVLLDVRPNGLCGGAVPAPEPGEQLGPPGQAGQGPPGQAAAAPGQPGQQGQPGSTAAEPARRIEAVDLVTGETRWSVRVPQDALCYLAGEPLPAALIVVDQRGTAATVDASTGRMLASGHVPAAVDSRSAGDLVARSHALVVGRLLVIGVRQGGGLAMTAYSVDTYAPIWSRPVDLGLPSTNSYTPLWDLSCGSLICLQSPSGIVAVDAGSGQARWRMADVGPMWSRGPVLLVGSEGRASGPRPRVLRLVDPQTGAVRVGVSGYDLHGVSGTGDNPFAAGTHELFVLGAHEAGSTMFLLVDGVRGERRFLGRAPGGYERCETNLSYLACNSGLDVVRIWRITR